MNFKRGDQIAYVPDHAAGDSFHNDVEHGFVTSVNEAGTIFCRFWNKFNKSELRTIANSEGCNEMNLIHFTSKPQALVDKILDDIENERYPYGPA